MPKVVWTIENDRRLLIRLIERSAKAYDTASLARLFEGATPKAIEERIAKLKREAKAAVNDKLPYPNTSSASFTVGAVSHGSHLQASRNTGGNSNSTSHSNLRQVRVRIPAAGGAAYSPSSAYASSTSASVPSSSSSAPTVGASRSTITTSTATTERDSTSTGTLNTTSASTAPSSSSPRPNTISTAFPRAPRAPTDPAAKEKRQAQKRQRKSASSTSKSRPRARGNGRNNSSGATRGMRDDDGIIAMTAGKGFTNPQGDDSDDECERKRKKLKTLIVQAETGMLGMAMDGVGRDMPRGRGGEGGLGEETAELGGDVEMDGVGGLEGEGGMEMVDFSVPVGELGEMELDGHLENTGSGFGIEGGSKTSPGLRGVPGHHPLGVQHQHRQHGIVVAPGQHYLGPYNSQYHEEQQFVLQNHQHPQTLPPTVAANMVGNDITHSPHHPTHLTPATLYTPTLPVAGPVTAPNIQHMGIFNVPASGGEVVTE